MLKSKKSPMASVIALAFFLCTYLAPIRAIAQDNSTAEVVTIEADASTPAPVVSAPTPESAAESGSTEPAPAPVELSLASEPTAATSQTKTALDNLSSELLNILIPAFVALIGAIAASLLNWIRRKFKVNVSNDQIAQWSAIAEKAADRGGEWARNKAKDLTDGKRIPGPEILEVATNWAIEMGQHFNLPEMGREKLMGLIEGHLHSVRRDPESLDPDDPRLRS